MCLYCYILQDNILFRIEPEKSKLEAPPATSNQPCASVTLTIHQQPCSAIVVRRRKRKISKAVKRNRKNIDPVVKSRKRQKELRVYVEPPDEKPDAFSDEVSLIIQIIKKIPISLSLIFDDFYHFQNLFL